MPLNEEGIFEFDSSFLSNINSAESFAESPEDIQDKQLEAAEDAQAKRSEAAINEQDHFGNIPLVSSVARGISIGGTDLINETDKFFGISDALKKYYDIDIKLGEDTLLADPEAIGLNPKNTFEAFLATGTQFLVPFTQTLKVASAGTKALNIFSKSPRLRGALDGILGSLPVDYALFNPDDPNLANLALTTGFVANDSSTGLALREWLATDPNDTETVNRLKNATVGMWAGVAGEGLIATAKALGKLTPKLKKDLQVVAKEHAEANINALEKAKLEKPEAVQELVEKLPKDKLRAEDFTGQPETATEALNRYHQTPSPKRDIKSPLYELTKEEDKAIQQLAGDALEGRPLNIDDPMLPVNMFKLKGPEEIRALIHGIGKVLEPKLAKSHTMEDLTKQASDLTGVNASKIREVADSTEYARGFVVASRLVQLKAADDYLKAIDKYLLDPSDIESEFAMKMAHLQSAEAVHAGADFSTAAGRLLNEFKQVADMASVTEQAELWRMDVLNKIMDSGQVTLKKAQRARKLATKSAAESQAVREGDIDPKAVRAKRKRSPKTTARKEDLGNITEKMQKQLAQARRATPEELQGLLANANQSKFLRTRNAVLENYINGLLSNPKTQLVNIAGNTSAILTSIFERAYAGFKSQGPDGVQGREVFHLMNGMWDGAQDAWSIFSKAMREGPSDLSVKNDLSKPHQRAISKEAFGASGNWGRVIDWVGDKVNIPGRLLLSADEVFKAINYRGELRALAHRKAYQDVVDQLGRAPKTDAEKALVVEKFGKMFQDNQMPQEILDGAKDFSRKQTFTNDLGATQIIGKDGKPRTVSGFSSSIRNAIEAEPTGFGKVLLPFFQTPVNLIKYAGERTPFVNKWVTPVAQELQSSNIAVRQLAEAKVATGNSIMLVGLGWAMGGKITGAPPTDPKLRRAYEDAGILPYHMWIPGVGYRPYDRFDPLGMTLGMAANLGVLARSLIDLTGHHQKYGLDEELIEAFNKAVAQAGIGTARLVADRHYLQAFGDLADFMSGDSRGLSRISRNFTVDKLILPYSSLRKAIMKGINPVKPADLHETSMFKEGDTLSEYVLKGMGQAAATWSEESLRLVRGWGDSPMLNLEGEPTYYPGSEFNTDLHLAPARILRGILNETLNIAPETPISDSPLINKIAELDMAVDAPRNVKSIKGVKLTDEEHQFYSKEVGKLNKQLRPLISSKAFNDLPEGEQRHKLEFKLKHNAERAKGITQRMFRDHINQTALDSSRGKRIARTRDIPGNILGGRQ